jgi:hypothetical protein
MIINVTVLNGMLDSTFNQGAGVTYTLELSYSGGTFSSPATIDFTTASGGVVQLTASTFFAISSGTTVTGIRVKDSFGDIHILETFATPETYTANGTFTVNNIIVTLS